MSRNHAQLLARLAVAAACVVAGLALEVGTASAESMVVVEDGQTLYGIAKRYDCSVKELQRANDLKGSMIFAGQTLVVPDCEPGKSGGKGKGKKAKAPRKEIAVYAKPGKVLVKTKKGQSIGRPWDGHLENPDKLPKGKGYFIRRPARAYGTAHMIRHIQKAIAAVRKRFPRVHTLAIGDLSDKDGGQISDHHSHRTGRDVDIGFYFKKKPSGYPDSFVSYTDAELDLPATWALLYAFARTADSPNGVQAIFLDYKVQKKLYDWAKDHGVPVKYLDSIFQYPDRDGGGLIKHEPSHDNHLHVRFKCPEKDKRCES
ncbi:MAG: penicillin-insensitive murein endopeptidase [Kofleriaceae bacterium]|nr:penicillin-insensitive murein endopeptidase [Myxococcales bacterium]MCB9559166.1 penicillin-insensitive murein endopeptidase [Kofleriaceae bacterium]